jgi:hypothetical protein
MRRKRQAGTLAVFGAALCGLLPILVEANVILFSLTLSAIAVLWFSAIILIFPDRSSSHVWKKLVAIAERIDVRLAAVGLGLFGTGLGILVPALSTLAAWVWLGITMILIGGFFIGGQIGKGIREMIEYRKGS